MNIAIRINRADPRMLVQLQKGGYNAFSIGESLIVKPEQRRKKANGNSRPVFALPEDLSRLDYDILLEAREMSNSSGKGTCVIVCGPSSEKLRSYERPRNSHVSACFSRKDSLVTVQANGRKESVIITRHFYVADASELAIEKEVLFDGDADSLPESLGHFKSAVRAALEKAASKTNKRIFYAI